MVVKLVNYNVGFAEDLLRIYPGARFIGLLRDAFGVCESMISRGARPDRVVPLYIYFVERLVQLQEKGLPLRIIRFEDLLADIREASESIYRFCGLDPMETTGLCLQDKQRVLDTGGRVIGTKKVDRFADFGCIGAHLREDVNAKAKARLPSELRRRIAEECGPILSRFGYVSEVRAT